MSAKSRRLEPATKPRTGAAWALFAAAMLITCGALAGENAAQPAAAAPRKVRTPAIFERKPSETMLAGAITTSDGKSTTGEVYTKLDMPLTIFDREKKRFVNFELKDAARIDVSVEEEKDEPYWYWKQSGSDEKVFTGKTYPARKYVTKLTYADGKTITGDIAGPVYLADFEGKETRYVLYKKNKGNEGQKLADLVYVTSIVITGVKAGDASGRAPEGAQSSTDSTLKK